MFYMVSVVVEHENPANSVAQLIQHYITIPLQTKD